MKRPQDILRLSSIALLVTNLVACTGKIHGDDNRTSQPSAPSQPSQAESPGTVQWTPGQEPVRPGASYLRRLTNAEYNSSVHDLLDRQGEVVDLAARYDFVTDSRVHGFESNATNVSMSAAVLERYRVAAEAIAEEATADEATRQRLLGCDLEGQPSCLADFIRRFGRRVYRRALADEEVTQLSELHAAGEDAIGGVELVLQHLLLSPNFLFRIEEGQTDDARPELLRLRGVEIATRLSYLLLGTTPSPALLDSAEAGQLDSKEGVEAAARAMLGEERGRPALRRFYEQWLRLDKVSELQRDAERFPEFDAELARSMREETNRLLDDLIWEPGRNFLELISSPRTFVDQRLASFYGLAAVPGWQAVELPLELGRAGLLGHAGLLAQTSHHDRTSSTLRGRYVRETLLCAQLPAPPANIPALPPVQPGQSERDLLAAHTADPACKSCHELLDPLGFGLEQFDAVGKFRELDEHGQPIEAAGQIAGYSSLAEPAFHGAIELGERLSQLPELGQCVVTQLFRHGFARIEQQSDSPVLSRSLIAFASSGYSFKELVVAFVTSDAFRYRERPEAQEGWQ